MERKSQCYLGMPNAVVYCLDSMKDNWQGRLYHHYEENAIEINSEMELLKNMEKMFDEIRFPFPGNNERHFDKRKENVMTNMEEKEKVLTDDEMLDAHGDLGTFIIRVQHRQHSSWQGRVTWVEEDKTVYFRSVWELMKLIDEAMEDKQEEETEPSSFRD